MRTEFVVPRPSELRSSSREPITALPAPTAPAHTRGRTRGQRVEHQVAPEAEAMPIWWDVLQAGVERRWIAVVVVAGAAVVGAAAAVLSFF
jgi:hypothetical protein